MREKIYRALNHGEPFTLGKTRFFKRVIDGKTVLAYENWHGSASCIASWSPDREDVNRLLVVLWRNRRNYRKPYGVEIEIVDSMKEAMPVELCPGKLEILTCENEITKEIRKVGLLTTFKTGKRTIICEDPKSGPWHILAALQHFGLVEDASPLRLSVSVTA